MSLVVSGGITSDPMYVRSTEILDLQTLQWTDGPDFPQEIAHTQAISFKNTFLAVGGYDDGETNHLLSIYEFDFEGQAWIERGEALTAGRGAFTAFLVPDYAVACS